MRPLRRSIRRPWFRRQAAGSTVRGGSSRHTSGRRRCGWQPAIAGNEFTEGRPRTRNSINAPTRRHGEGMSTTLPRSSASSVRSSITSDAERCDLDLEFANLIADRGHRCVAFFSEEFTDRFAERCRPVASPLVFERVRRCACRTTHSNRHRHALRRPAASPSYRLRMMRSRRASRRSSRSAALRSRSRSRHRGPALQPHHRRRPGSAGAKAHSAAAIGFLRAVFRGPSSDRRSRGPHR